MIICSTFPEIWRVTDVIVIFHFEQFFALTAQKNENLKKKMKTKGRDMSIFHKCTKDHNHILFCSWDMTCGGCNCYFSLWAIFCPFTTVTAQKIKISKIWKNYLEILFFTHVYQNLWLDDARFMRYGVRRMGGRTDRRKDGKTDT